MCFCLKLAATVCRASPFQLRGRERERKKRPARFRQAQCGRRRSFSSSTNWSRSATTSGAIFSSITSFSTPRSLFLSPFFSSPSLGGAASRRLKIAGIATELDVSENEQQKKKKTSRARLAVRCATGFFDSLASSESRVNRVCHLFGSNDDQQIQNIHNTHQLGQVFSTRFTVCCSCGDCHSIHSLFAAVLFSATCHLTCFRLPPTPSSLISAVCSPLSSSFEVRNLSLCRLIRPLPRP